MGGSDNPYIDQPDVQQFNHVVLGRFGGNSAAGQVKNEDGCLIWVDKAEEWKLVMILDAHNSAQSTELVIAQVGKHQNVMASLLSGKVSVDFLVALKGFCCNCSRIAALWRHVGKCRGRRLV
ncbi:hypothetical protein [Planococcus antarcticus]|uniref:hypothetical protein n=1 Tax=Planococcus antarcticus TaxID=161360 RepID=UPI002F261FC0